MSRYFASQWPWLFADRALSSNQLLEEFFTGWTNGNGGENQTHTPAVNVYDNGNAFLVRLELAGLDKDSIQITSQGADLWIEATRPEPTTGKDTRYQQREAGSGKYSRKLRLSSPVDSEHVQATYKNGILSVTLPRAREAISRKIEIR